MKAVSSDKFKVATIIRAHTCNGLENARDKSMEDTLSSSEAFRTQSLLRSARIRQLKHWKHLRRNSILRMKWENLFSFVDLAIRTLKKACRISWKRRKKVASMRSGAAIPCMETRTRRLQILKREILKTSQMNCRSLRIF